MYGKLISKLATASEQVYPIPKLQCTKIGPAEGLMVVGPEVPLGPSLGSEIRRSNMWKSFLFSTAKHEQWTTQTDKQIPISNENVHNSTWYTSDLRRGGLRAEQGSSLSGDTEPLWDHSISAAKLPDTPSHARSSSPGTASRL